MMPRDMMPRGKMSQGQNMQYFVAKSNICAASDMWQLQRVASRHLRLILQTGFGGDAFIFIVFEINLAELHHDEYVAFA